MLRVNVLSSGRIKPLPGRAGLFQRHAPCGEACCTLRSAPSVIARVACNSRCSLAAAVLALVRELRPVLPGSPVCRQQLSVSCAVVCLVHKLSLYCTHAVLFRLFIVFVLVVRNIESSLGWPHVLPCERPLPCECGMCAHCAASVLSLHRTSLCHFSLKAGNCKRQCSQRRCSNQRASLRARTSVGSARMLVYNGSPTPRARSTHSSACSVCAFRQSAVVMATCAMTPTACLPGRSKSCSNSQHACARKTSHSVTRCECTRECLSCVLVPSCT